MKVIDAIKALSKAGVITHTLVTLANPAVGYREVEYLFENDAFYVVRVPNGVDKFSKREWSRVKE